MRESDSESTACNLKILEIHPGLVPRLGIGGILLATGYYWGHAGVGTWMVGVLINVRENAMPVDSGRPLCTLWSMTGRMRDILDIM